MAIFKVGQRVRIIGAFRHPRYIGLEATIVAIPCLRPEFPETADCGISIDGCPSHGPGGFWSCAFQHLAPLTDPKADAFIESIKKLKPYEEPKRLTYAALVDAVRENLR